MINGQGVVCPLTKEGKITVEKKMKKGIKKLLAEAGKVITTILVAEAQDLLGSNDHTFVDLRDFRELKREGKAPGTFSCPRGMLGILGRSGKPLSQGHLQRGQDVRALLCQFMALDSGGKNPGGDGPEIGGAFQGWLQKVER
jgi:hypothetical protein